MVSLLSLFQIASGQEVNLNKSSIFFTPNTAPVLREAIFYILNMNEASTTCTYLVLPNMFGRNKNSLLGFLKDKVRKKVLNWEGRFLSKAGKELLIKTVAQALSAYAMNVFLLLLSLSKEIEQILCKYWWQSKNGAGIHWKS